MTVLLDPPAIFGHTIFSDDVRNEVDGKITYVGVYSGTLFVRGTFPAIISKFCITGFFSQRKDIFEPGLGLHIFLPGDADEKASIQAVIGEAETGVAEQAAKEIGLTDPESPIIQLQAQITISPLTINEPGLIKVRILRKSEFHRLGSIRVVPAPIKDR
jgi:hypothetical protein